MTDPLRVTAILMHHRTLYRAEWVFLLGDPAAVRLVIDPTREAAPPRPVPCEDDTAHPQQAEWCFARAALRDAVKSPTPPGVGSVRLQRDPDRTRVLHIALLTTGGWWEAITDTRVAAEFAAASYAHVSQEWEQHLLGEAAERLDPEKLTQPEELA